MTDEPQIIKELRKEEKLGKFQKKVENTYEELEIPEKFSDDKSGFSIENVERNWREDNANNEYDKDKKLSWESEGKPFLRKSEKLREQSPRQTARSIRLINTELAGSEDAFP